MISLKDSDIVDIAPENLAELPEVKAVGYAIHNAMARFIGYCENISVYAMIDTASDEVLDLLAMELGTQYYDDTLDIEAKRALVKHTLIWYMTAGTPSAVAELIAAVFSEGELSEWFEYGDEPYYFKITTNATLTPEMNAEFSAMLERVKNARSHIRSIEIHRTVDQTIYASTFADPAYKPAAIIDGFSTEGESVDQTIYAMTSELATTKPAAIIDGFEETGDEVEDVIIASASELSVTKPAAVLEELSYDAESVTQDIVASATELAITKQAAVLEELSYSSEVESAIAAGVAADNGIQKNIIEE